MTTLTDKELIKEIRERIGSLDVRDNIERRAYEIALASLEREQIRHEHAKWSDSTFGCVGPIGPLKHLSKEALEAAAEPDDLSECADMQFLLWDAQRRADCQEEFEERGKHLRLCMWVMMKLKRTGQEMYFQCYDSRETAEMAIKVMNSVASSWEFYIS